MDADHPANRVPFARRSTAHRDRQIGVAKQLFEAMGSAIRLGCVINSQGIMQSPVVREHARIPEDQLIQISIAIGWLDKSFPAKSVVSTRKSVDVVVAFMGSDD